MKHLFLLLLAVFALSCAKRTVTPSINIISRAAQGLLYVECDGKGTSRSVAEADAKASVLNRLLYDGIPDADVSAVRLPMVEDKSKLTSQQRSDATKLMQGEALNRYFTEVSQIGSNNASSGQLKRFSMKVNYDLFRRDLENKGVVRKFGL